MKRFRKIILFTFHAMVLVIALMTITILYIQNISFQEKAERMEKLASRYLSYIEKKIKN